jgi:diguanylate cyclase (GGDEF)-like protein
MIAESKHDQTGTSQRILLVDDDDIDRMTVKRALAKSNSPLHIIEASNFAEATQLLKEQSFDCVLLDYRLAGQDGLNLIKEIHAKNLSEAPIVMLSGMDDESTMLNCLKEGAQDFLLKSELSSHSLIRAIRYAQERKEATLQLRYLAQHDSLTSLSNRSLFIGNVQRAIAHAKRSDIGFAIIFIDLDNFKNINDTLGHEAGDTLLITISERIKSTLREEDIVGRLGGDEFAVLLEGIVAETSLINITQNLLNAIRESLNITGKMIYPTASLGVATYPNNADEAAAIIKCADLAMYKAKQNGRNNYHFYSEDLQIIADDYDSLKTDIYNALACNEFELYYQPQVNTSEHTIIGIEALIRWNHPTKGFIPPNYFIPIAESLGLINKIGDWVIEEACAQLKAWLSSYQHLHHNFKMAINISAYQIRQNDLTDKLSKALNDNKIPTGVVELELTESALIDDMSHCVEKFNELKKLGLQFAIDDFGTGFASFRHFQQLPLETIKIDKSFIDHICSSKKSYEIVKAMIVMAHALEMKVVAEGVETVEQATLLKTLSCDTLQGYHFWRPLPAQEITDLLSNPDQVFKQSSQQEAYQQ